ncbi:MAG: hypothetical protein Q8N05_01045 [Bacteroidota bacterium]|nr:hypothetical protein [Bacteroidota bacterium]
MVQFSRKIVQTVFLCVLILTGINGCKDDYVSVVPYVYVDMNINPISYIDNIPGAFYYFANKGYGGIILLYDQTENSNPFLAFDAACTYETSSTCRVVPEESGFLANCPCCGSKFMLLGGNGSPINGPAIEPLKQYRTSYIGGRVIIRN